LGAGPRHGESTEGSRPEGPAPNKKQPAGVAVLTSRVRIGADRGRCRAEQDSPTEFGQPDGVC
jgi:hypothetical protein